MPDGGGSDFAWSDLLGVQLTGTSPYTEANFAWLGDDLRGDAPAYPLLFRVPVLEVKCTTAVKLAELVYPEGHRSPEVFTDGETPYTHFKKFTGKPLVTLNRVGKGAVIYISAPIGREIASRQDPWLKRLVGALHYEVCLPRSPSRCRRPREFNWCSDASRECRWCRWSIITAASRRVRKIVPCRRLGRVKLTIRNAKPSGSRQADRRQRPRLEVPRRRDRREYSIGRTPRATDHHLKDTNGQSQNRAGRLWEFRREPSAGVSRDTAGRSCRGVRH